MSAYSDYMAGGITEAEYGQAMARERDDEDDREFCLHCTKRTCIHGYCRWNLCHRERNDEDEEEEEEDEEGLDGYFPDPDEYEEADDDDLGRKYNDNR